MDYAWSIPLRPDALRPDTMSWTLQKSVRQFRSPDSGSLESVTVPGWFWKISITLPPRLSDDGGEIEGYFGRLCGGANVALIYHWLRPVPRGTMRGVPTLAAAAARGATQLLLNTTGTLAGGDFIGVGGRVYRVAAACAPVASVLTVPLDSNVDRALASGAPVAWDHPTVRCIMPASSFSVAYQPGGVMAGTPVDLEETK